MGLAEMFPSPLLRHGDGGRKHLVNFQWRLVQKLATPLPMTSANTNRAEHPHTGRCYGRNIRKAARGAIAFSTPAEMAAGCQEHPDWLRHTFEIAERCNFAFSLWKTTIPAFTPPDGSLPSDYLRQLVFQGLRERYGFPRRPVPATGDGGTRHYQ